jgi:hypothetical protein
MLVNRASLPQEFFDITSPRLLLQPEPQFLHARLMKMAMSASFDLGGDLGLPIEGRSFGGNGAPYQTSPEEGRLMISDGIYDQAIMFVPELGKGPGHTIRMNRPSFQNTTYSQAAREVAPGATISVTPIALSSEQTSITIRRFAGPYDQANSRVAPLGVDRFDSKVMLHRAANIAGLNLKRDFDATLDFWGVKLFDQANTIVRPAGFAADNDHLAAGDGPMTWALLQSVERQMDEASIPYFPNGKRAMVLHPRQVEQLTLDPTYQRLTRYTPATNPFFNGTYVGAVGNWEIFKSVTLTKVTSSGGAQPQVYYGQAFGPGAIGAGVGEMPRAAYNTQDNYGETALVIWLFYAGFEVLDSRFIASVRTS